MLRANEDRISYLGNQTEMIIVFVSLQFIVRILVAFSCLFFYLSLIVFSSSCKQMSLLPAHLFDTRLSVFRFGMEANLCRIG